MLASSTAHPETPPGDSTSDGEGRPRLSVERSSTLREFRNNRPYGALSVSNTVTEPVVLSAAARSGMPSPSKSATAA